MNDLILVPARLQEESNALTPRNAGIILLPLIALGLESVLRRELAAIMGVPDIMTCWFGLIVYWLTRLLLLVCFLVLITKLVPASGLIKQPSTSKAIEQPDPLLGLRGLASMMVLFGHFFMVIFPPHNVTNHKAMPTGFWLLTASPWVGVWLFFTLSGYLMGKAFVAKRYQVNIAGLKNFSRNRALRICPLFYISIGIMIILVRRDFIVLNGPYPIFNLLSVLTFDDQGYSPIGALWSVSTEVQFYCMVPFLYVLLRGAIAKIGGVAAILVVAMISVAYKYVVMAKFISVPLAWFYYCYVPMLPNIDTFLIGLFTAFAVDKFRTDERTVRYGLPIGILITIAFYVCISRWSEIAMLDAAKPITVRLLFISTAPAITALFGAVVIFLFERADRTNQPGGSGSRIAWTVTTRTGLWSYAIYVWHEPVFNVLRKYAPTVLKTHTSIHYFLIALPLVFIIAFLTYRFIELPFDRMKRGVASASS